MGGGKNMYDDYSQIFVSPWNVRNVSRAYTCTLTCITLEPGFEAHALNKQY